MLQHQKHHLIFTTLFVIIALLCGKTYAIDLPFLNNKNNSNIEFSDSSSEKLLRPLLNDVLKTNNQNRVAANIELSLNKQARLDKESMEKLLRSEGFYSSTIIYEIKDEKIYYKITPDKPYIIDNAKIKTSLEQIPQIDELGIKIGDVFKAEAILSAISDLKKYLEKNQCLWQINVEYNASVNHVQKTAEIVFIIEDSPQVTFRDVSFEGLEDIKPSYIKTQLGFKEGECFKRSKIETSRLNLFQTGLVSGVETKLIRENENVDISFEISERKHRTIKLGGGVSSDEGASLSAGWEHRNIFGEAEKLQVNAKVSKLFHVINSELDFPSFLSKKQTLAIIGEISQENLDAFDSDSMSVSAILKRRVSRSLTASIGSKLELTNVKNHTDLRDETLGLISFPFALDYDKRDNILDPKSGWLISGEVSPFIDVLDTTTGFVKTSIGASAYHTLDKKPLKPTFAIRAATGSINGLSTSGIPIGERFFAGGGGSVRGYEFQKLGPLDSEIPTGGRSFIETSFETRVKFSPKWGGVLFIDGGNAYDDIIPSFGNNLQWAYGGGVRYYTDFAPLRLDIAIPLDKREGIDSSFQFYISIGQAF